MIGMFLLFSLIVASPVMAVEEEAVVPNEGLAGEAHEQITSKIKQLANTLDSVFADKRADDELNRSTMRLTYSYTVREDSLPDPDTQFRFNLRLPTLQNMFRYQKDLEADKEKEKKKSEVSKKKVPEEKDPWFSRFDAGINVSYPPVVFTRYRLRKNWSYDNLIPRFVYELGWFSNLGVIQTTGMNVDRKISENQLFRFINETTWNMTHHKFTTSHGPSLLFSLADHCALSYSMRASSLVDEGTWYFNNYNMNITYQ